MFGKYLEFSCKVQRACLCVRAQLARKGCASAHISSERQRGKGRKVLTGFFFAPRSESEEEEGLWKIKMRGGGRLEGGLVVFPPLVKVKVKQLVEGKMTFTDLTNLEEKFRTAGERERECKICHKFQNFKSTLYPKKIK